MGGETAAAFSNGSTLRGTIGVSMSDNNPDLSYCVNEYVLCYHGVLLYEAKVLKAEYWDENDLTKSSVGPHYFVHYKGWKEKWDEWVTENRLMKVNDENMTLLKSLQKSHKSTTNVGATNKRAASNDASTPSIKGRRKDPNSNSLTSSTQNAPEEKEQIKLSFSDTLKCVLVDEWENITRNQQIHQIPAVITIKQVLEDYKAWVKDTNPFKIAVDEVEPSGKPGSVEAALSLSLDAHFQVVEEVCDGIMEYFNLALGSLLLYSHERIQYKEILGKLKSHVSADAAASAPLTKTIELCDSYGPFHLLRLMTKLPELISSLNFQSSTIKILEHQFQMLLVFLDERRDQYFNKDSFCNLAPIQLNELKSIT